MSSIRLLAADDAPALTELVTVNREFLAPWSPLVAEEFYTEAGQRAVVADMLEQYQRGTAVPMVILTGSEAGSSEDSRRVAGRVAGRVTLSAIVRRSFQSASLGYWLGEEFNGRGLATAAVREVAALAFGEMGLHRIEAATLPHNVRSRRVLERNGFSRFGLAPGYLRIAGTWQDHLLFQLLASDLGWPS